MKKLLTIVLSVLLLISITGCDEFFNGGSVSDDWRDFEFKLNGTVFKLPWYLSDFEKEGWEQYWGLAQLDDTLEPLNSVHFYLKNEDHYSKETSYLPINLMFYNTTNKTQLVRDCQINTIGFSNYFEKFTVAGRDPSIIYEVELGGGITWGSSVADVKAVFGDVDPEFQGGFDSFYYIEYHRIDNNILYTLNLGFGEYGLFAIGFHWRIVNDGYVHEGSWR